MRTRKWMFAPAALVLALGMAGSVSANDNEPNAPIQLAAAEKPAKPARERKAGREGKAGKERNSVAKQIAELEQVSGKPLTDEQKQQVAAAAQERNTAVKQANERFQEQKAKILGITPKELKAKERAAKKAKKAAAA